MPSEGIRIEISLSAEEAEALGELAGLTCEEALRELVRGALAMPRSWACDDCGQPILRPREGLMQWVWAPGRSLARGLRLVHTPEATPEHAPWRRLRLVGEGPRRACGQVELKASEELYDIPLHHLLGADGLMQMLARLEEGVLPRDRLLELIQRLHLPHYEAARCHLEEAIRRGVIRPNMLRGFYWQGELLDVLRAARGWGDAP